MSQDEALEAMRHAVSVESLTCRYNKGRNNIWINPWVLKGIIPSFEYVIIKNGDTVCCKETEAINNYIPNKYLADLSASYSCILKYDKYEERFPFIVGPPDSVYNSILSLKTIPCLEPYFFRLEKLLEITPRNNHWYYKVAFLVDKITNYKNVDKGISLHTFTSVIDSSKQNYITVSPDDYCSKKKYPLIILMNPAFSYKTHLLTSVYLHRIGQIKYLKTLCEDNGYVVLISSNRSYFSEGLNPIGVTDVLEAYTDAKLKYNIDKSRVFAFGSCLGGTKALQFAKVMYPKCAGLAMYNPAVYHRNELKDFESLQNLPIYIHHDNFDTHTPIITSKRLVNVAKEKGLSLTYQFDDFFRNTYYNYFIDQDVFSFFNSVSSNSCFDSFDIRDYSSGDEVMNVFAKRFCIIYGTRKKHLSLDSIARNLQDQWADYYNSPCAIFSDTTFLRKQIEYDGVILLGDSASNIMTEKVLYRRKMRQERRHFEKFLREDESDRCYEYSFYSNDVQYLLVGSRSMSGFDYTFKHHPWFKSLHQD